MENKLSLNQIARVIKLPKDFSNLNSNELSKKIRKINRLDLNTEQVIELVFQIGIEAIFSESQAMEEIKNLSEKWDN
jgi:hypothetical protein